MKIALIAAPIVGLLAAAIVVIAINSGPSRDPKTPDPETPRQVADLDIKKNPSEPPAPRPDPRPWPDAGKQQQVQFLGAVGQGRRFVIIADRSGSMNAKIRPADGSPPREAITFLHDELIDTLTKMEAGSFFYVSFFGSTSIPMPGADTWIEGGRDLTEIKNWVRGVRPSGGTNPLPSFTRAFALDPAPDVIFFMTDGAFADAAAKIADMNARLPRKAVIHTIQFSNARGAAAGPRQAKIVESFELPAAVAELFTLHAKGPVSKKTVSRPHKQLEDIAAASGGTFRVFGAGDAPARGPRATPVLAVHGALTNLDPVTPLRPGCHAKAYDVTLTAGMNYQIDMVGDVDPFLCLIDARGKMVAANDNSGGGQNALISFRAATTATYRIIATSAAPGRTGAFALTVIDRSP